MDVALTREVPIIKEDTRHYGLDLLRIVSMLMILFSHFSVYSMSKGILVGDINTTIRQVLSAFFTVSVNCYILTSAFFLSKQKFKLSHLFKLELIVVFWLAICSLINGTMQVSGYWENEFMTPFFPVIMRVFWFYSAYFGLYLLSPLINIGIKHMNKGQHLLACILLVLMATALNNAMTFSNAFNFLDGYNLSWFVVLYFVGGYVRNYVYKKNIKSWLAILAYLLATALIIGDYYFIKAIRASNPWFEARFDENAVFHYNSLFVFLSSLAFFFIFLKIDIKNKAIKSIIKIITPHIFAIYILDRGYIQRLQYDYALKLIAIPELPFLQIFIIIILIFMFRIGLDYLRGLLFRLFTDRKWYKRFMIKLDDLPYKLINSVNN